VYSFVNKTKRIICRFWTMRCMCLSYLDNNIRLLDPFRVLKQIVALEESFPTCSLLCFCQLPSQVETRRLLCCSFSYWTILELLVQALCDLRERKKQVSSMAGGALST
jgi:hypothetical protein